MSNGISPEAARRNNSRKERKTSNSSLEMDNHAISSSSSPNTESISSITPSTAATTPSAIRPNLKRMPFFATFSSKPSTILIPPSTMFGQSSVLVVLDTKASEAVGTSTEYFAIAPEPTNTRPSILHRSSFSQQENTVSISPEEQISLFSDTYVSFPPPPESMPKTRSLFSRALSFHGIFGRKKGRKGREGGKEAHQPQEPTTTLTLKPLSSSIIQLPPPTANQRAKLASHSSRYQEGINPILERSRYWPTPTAPLSPQEDRFTFPTGQLNTEEKAKCLAQLEEWKRREEDKELKKRGIKYGMRMSDEEIQRRILGRIEEVEEDDTWPDADAMRARREVNVFASGLRNEGLNEGEAERETRRANLKSELESEGECDTQNSREEDEENRVQE